jgi:two-component system sensor histidine kinase GlrK
MFHAKALSQGPEHGISWRRSWRELCHNAAVSTVGTLTFAGLSYRAMRNSFYPRSFSKLLLVGFVLVALPLIAALITSAVAVDQLANRSQTAVYQAVRATQGSRRLSELLTAMERSARQIVILNDRGLLDAYDVSRVQFQEVSGQLAELQFDPAQRADLGAIIKTEQQIYGVLSNSAIKPVALQSQVGKFVDLSNRAQNIVAKSNQLIDSEVGAMLKAAATAQRIMFWQVLALVPIAILLVAGFTILITRPIRQIDAAIREIGDGRLKSSVVVSGPKDLEHLGARLEWMRQQLLDLEQQKNRFLQQVSHELKTPLTALREGAQLLSDGVVGQLTPEQREITKILRHNSLELQQRIEELLDYGATQFHELKLDIQAVDPQLLMERVAQHQKLALQAKNLTLLTKVSDVVLHADAVRIQAAFDNLLSNAIRFSPAGGTITVDIYPDGDALTVDVIDQGPGLAAADESRIFEPFYQGRVQGSGAVKGSGLGLSIVKEYVAAHGGSVEALSGDGARGAHFCIRLPLMQASPT